MNDLFQIEVISGSFVCRSLCVDEKFLLLLLLLYGLCLVLHMFVIVGSYHKMFE